MVLFHRIADLDCARIRKLIVELNLSEHVQFRNIDVSESSAKALLELTGKANIPVMEINGQILSVFQDIVQALKSFKSLGPK